MREVAGRARGGAFGLLGAVLAGALTGVAQVPVSNNWPVVGHDAGGMRYSPLTQIRPDNVAQLARAWTYHTGDQGTQFETTPIVVDGVLYLSTQ